MHLRTSIMQKSLSVIASAKEKMPGLSNKTQSVEDASKKSQRGQEDRMLSEVDETPEHFPKMIISQSVEYSKTPLKMGIMKQQVPMYTLLLLVKYIGKLGNCFSRSQIKVNNEVGS